MYRNHKYDQRHNHRSHHRDSRSMKACRGRASNNRCIITSIGTKTLQLSVAAQLFLMQTKSAVHSLFSSQRTPCERLWRACANRWCEMNSGYLCNLFWKQIKTQQLSVHVVSESQLRPAAQSSLASQGLPFSESLQKAY